MTARKMARGAQKASEKTEPQTIKPMDPSIREETVGQQATNNRRVCYAIKTLVSEVERLFPETIATYSNYDGHNTALDVAFDYYMIDKDDQATFVDLLRLVGDDHRVEGVIVERDETSVLVSMRPSARTKDLRDTFDLNGAYLVLMGDETDVSDPEFGAGWEDGSL